MSRPQPATTMHARSGMVASIDHLASSAGVAMLRAGGSAVDAAVATSAVLAVTSQHMCGMGGDLFALVHHQSGPPEVLDASGRAGSGADPDRLRAEGHTVMPFRNDIRSTPVPGCVDGWLELHERHGTLPLAEVFAPAIDAAESGFPAAPLLVSAIRGIVDVDGADDYTRDGPVGVGQLIQRAGIARGLRSIIDQGRDGWYGGEFGEGLIAVGGGEYTAEDLAQSQANWVDPLGARIWGHDVWTVPPSTQGYLSLAGALIAEGLELPDDEVDPRFAHLLIESARFAGFDRPDVLSDRADGAALIAEERLTERRNAIDADRAATLGDSYAGGGTMYMCAVDANRMGVSLIQSNASGFGVHLTVPSLGVFLHNRGMGFNLRPGHDAEYGPGRRPPHTLSPALVTHPDGSLRSVLGTMGGDAQPQIVLQMLTRLLHRNESAGAVIAGPRWVLDGPETGFDTWDDADANTVLIEPHSPEAWDEGLTSRGHRVDRRRANFGHAHCIEVGEHDVLSGAADPRALTGGALGY